jgi:hypothetical protein
MEHTRAALLGSGFTLSLMAAVAAGLLIGIERGWRQRDEAEGTRVAGVRTFTLIGGSGGLIAVLANLVSPLVAAVVATGVVVALAAAFLRRPANPEQRDATTMVAAFGSCCWAFLRGRGSQHWLSLGPRWRRWCWRHASRATGSSAH